MFPGYIGLAQTIAELRYHIRTAPVLPKPRLWRSGHWWICSSGARYEVCGMGETPQSAYGDWLSTWHSWQKTF